MLTLTENASTIVKDITTQPGLAETAGLRITSEETPGADVRRQRRRGARARRPDRRAGRRHGLPRRGAASMLDDKVLDAAVDPEGKVEFALGLQA